MKKTLESVTDVTDLYGPIPIDSTIEGWQQIEIQENNEPLVGVGFCSGNDFRGLFTASAYGPDLNIHDCYGDTGVENGLAACFMREGVAEKLLIAESLLPKNHHFVVYDAWRSKEVQSALYEQYSKKLTQQNPNWSEEQIAIETQKFVSLPSTDPTKPSTHNTGGAVDLKIISLPDEIEARVKEIDRLIPALDRDGKSKEIYDLEFERHNIIAQNAQELNFGTTFDYADAEAAPDFYEKLAIQRELTAEELEARDNRRLLYNIMKTVGGMPFPYEWWHYNFRNQMAAVTCGGQIATYGSAELSVDNKKYETTLKNQRKGAIKIYEFIKSNDTGKLDIITQTNMGRTVINAVEKSGKYSETSLHQIEAIKPPDSKVAA